MIAPQPPALVFTSAAAAAVAAACWGSSQVALPARALPPAPLLPSVEPCQLVCQFECKAMPEFGSSRLQAQASPAPTDGPWRATACDCREQQRPRVQASMAHNLQGSVVPGSSAVQMTRTTVLCHRAQRVCNSAAGGCCTANARPVASMCSASEAGMSGRKQQQRPCLSDAAASMQHPHPAALPPFTSI